MGWFLLGSLYDVTIQIIRVLHQSNGSAEIFSTDISMETVEPVCDIRKANQSSGSGSFEV